MSDLSAYIEACMVQMGVLKYSFRTYYKKIAHNTVLSSGKYYFFDLSQLSGYQINANNIMFFCNDARTYGISHYSPIFQGQVHFVGFDKGTVEVRALDAGSSDSPSLLAAVPVSIIEITPL